MTRFLRYNIVYALVAACLVLLVEELFYVYQYRTPLLGLVISRYFLYVFLLSIVLSLMRRRALAITILCALHMIQLVQALHINYFGLPIMPEIIGHFFRDPVEDGGEILESVSLFNPYIIIMVLACMAANVAWVRKAHHRNVKMMFAPVLLCGLAIFPYGIATAVKPHKFYPHMAETLGSNFINAFSLYLLRDEFAQKMPNYAPYQLTQLPAKAKNIILIIGESCNPSYMSLFGYAQDTTPLLRKLQAEEGTKFLARGMLSTSVSTFPSITMLMNIIREPGNMHTVQEKQQNLMHLAKKNHFKTAWIGNQSANNLVYAGLEKADFVMTSQTANPMDFKTQHDDRLLEELQRYAWGDSGNFMVIHQRNLHSPYESNYAHHKELQIVSDADIASAPDRQTAVRGTYANAMRMNDYTLYHLISHLKKVLSDKGESYIFYTSDHGELLGEEGLFGHSYLRMSVAQVPFLAYGVNPDARWMKRLSEAKTLTHYDLGLLIAEKLGVGIKNPNARPGVYYLHSPDVYNASRSIEYHLDADGKIASQQEFLMHAKGVQ